MKNAIMSSSNSTEVKTHLPKYMYHKGKEQHRNKQKVIIHSYMLTVHKKQMISQLISIINHIDHSQQSSFTSAVMYAMQSKLLL